MWATSASGGDLDQLRQGEDLAALRHAAEAVAADRDQGARHEARELLRDQHADTELLGQGVHARGLVGGRADHREVEPAGGAAVSSEERRVGKGWVITGESRGA